MAKMRRASDIQGKLKIELGVIAARRKRKDDVRKPAEIRIRQCERSGAFQDLRRQFEVLAACDLGISAAVAYQQQVTTLYNNQVALANSGKLSADVQFAFDYVSAVAAANSNPDMKKFLASLPHRVVERVTLSREMDFYLGAPAVTVADVAQVLWKYVEGGSFAAEWVVEVLSPHPDLLQAFQALYPHGYSPSPPRGRGSLSPSVPQAPLAVPQAPLGVQQAPFGVQQAPFGVQQAPFGVQQAPFGVQQAPFGVQQAPFSVQRAPFGVQQAPFGVQQAPLAVVQPTPAVLQAPHEVLPGARAQMVLPVYPSLPVDAPAVGGASQFPPMDPSLFDSVYVPDEPN
jgi:hypothetical protein